MRKILSLLVALGALSLLGACTEMNNCTGNGFENPQYCIDTLHPNAGPYAFHNMHAE